MRIIFSLLAMAVVFAAGCSLPPRDERVIIHCPACGTELESLFKKDF